jgi:hypothetical protein
VNAKSSPSAKSQDSKTKPTLLDMAICSIGEHINANEAITVKSATILLAWLRKAKEQEIGLISEHNDGECYCPDSQEQLGRGPCPHCIVSGLLK